MKRMTTAADAAERRLLGSSSLALAVLAVTLALTTPARAEEMAPKIVPEIGPEMMDGFATSAMSSAEKLRRLDIMLMVTGLRCRATEDNFIADYGNFTTSHLGELNAANAELRDGFVQAHGPVGGQRALDRLSTVMANNYGQGHPRLSCRDLKIAAQNLAQVRGRATLEEAADQLLTDGGAMRFALAQR